MAVGSNVSSMKMPPFFLLAALLALSAVPGHAGQKKGLAAGTPLIPDRRVIRERGYTLDTVADKRQRPEDKVVRMDLRVTGSEKKPLKPDEVFLVDADGRRIEADDRDDHDVGNEENSGLPLSVSPSVNSAGGAGVGMGVNLNRLFGGGGTYSYSRLDFLRKDFVAGMSLKVVLRDKTELVVPLVSIGRKVGE